MSRKKQILLFAAALLVFAVASRFLLKDQEQTLTDEPPEPSPEAPIEDFPAKWRTVENKEAITTFFEEEVPGLKEARKQELTVKHEKSLSFESDTDKKITVLESWYNEHELFLLYKLDAEDVSLKQSDPPRLLDTIQVEGIDSDLQSQELRTFRQNAPVRWYDGELYTYTSLTPIRQEEEIETTGGTTVSGMFPAEQFDETVLSSFTLHLGQYTWKTEEANLHFSYDPEAYDVTTYTFDEQAVEKSGIRYKPLRLESDLRGVRLYTEVKADTPLSRRMDAKLYKEEQYSSLASFHHLQATDKENIYVSPSRPALERAPEGLKLTMNHLHKKSDVTFSFETDISDFQDQVSIDSNKKTMTLDKPLGTYNNTDVLLKEKSYTYPTQLEWNLTLEPAEDAESFLSPVPFQPVTGKFGAGSAPVRHVKINDHPDKRAPAGFLGGGHGNDMSIYSERFDLEEEGPLTLTVYNLTDRVTFKQQSTAVR